MRNKKRHSLGQSAERPSWGLALGSVTLGLVGLASSFLLVGAAFAFVGLVLGCLHLARSDAARDLAFAGTVIALAGLIASVVFAGAYRYAAGKDKEGHPGLWPTPKMVGYFEVTPAGAVEKRLQ